MSTMVVWDWAKTAETQEELAKMNANTQWPDVAEDGKAFVVFWADGRAVMAKDSKEKVNKWADKEGDWADIVSITYGPPEFKGKAVKVGETDKDAGLKTWVTDKVQDHQFNRAALAGKNVYQEAGGKTNIMQPEPKAKKLKKPKGFDPLNYYTDFGGPQPTLG